MLTIITTLSVRRNKFTYKVNVHIISNEVQAAVLMNDRSNSETGRAQVIISVRIKLINPIKYEHNQAYIFDKTKRLIGD